MLTCDDYEQSAESAQTWSTECRTLLVDEESARLFQPNYPGVLNRHQLLIFLQYDYKQQTSRFRLDS
jgi:hypothetical protein